MSYYYNLKFVSSGGRIEAYHYTLAQERDFDGKNKTGRKGSRKIGAIEKMQNRREVLNRARNQIIRLVNCNEDLTTFISLTYAENMQDLIQSKVDLNKCIKKLQRVYSNFKYLYVLEFQSRGAIHYHMLCNMPVPVETAKSKHIKSCFQKELEQYFQARFWPHGFTDIRNLKQEGNTNVGLYVSVYLVEELYKLDLQGAKCYGYSRNLSRPQKEYVMTNVSNETILSDFSKDYDLVYARSYGMAKDYGNELKLGTVNYFDMYKKGE